MYVRYDLIQKVQLRPQHFNLCYEYSLQVNVFCDRSIYNKYYWLFFGPCKRRLLTKRLYGGYRTLSSSGAFY